MTEGLNGKGETTSAIWNPVLFPPIAIKMLKEIKHFVIRKRKGGSIPTCTLLVSFIRHFSEFSQNSCCYNGSEAKTCQLSISALLLGQGGRSAAEPSEEVTEIGTEWGSASLIASERTKSAPSSLSGQALALLLMNFYQGAQFSRTGFLSGGHFLNDGRAPEGTTPKLVLH